MAFDFLCPACGRRLRADEGQRGAEARCPGCGGVCRVPHVAPPLPPPGQEPETLDEVIENCPSCNARLADDAVLCIECGFNLKTGRKYKTRVKRFDKTWLAGPTLAARLRRLVLFDFVCAPALLLGVGVRLGQMPVAVLLVGLLTVGFVAWIGCITSVRLTRSRKGDLKIELSRYLAFFPAGRRVLKMDRYEAILLEYSLNWDFFEASWLYTKIFLRRYYYVDDDSDHLAFCRLSLKGRRESDTVVIYRGYDDAEAREIIEVLELVTDLPLVR